MKIKKIEKISNKIFNDIKDLFDIKNEDICLENVMKLDKKIIKRIKIIKNLIIEL